MLMPRIQTRPEKIVIHSSRKELWWNRPHDRRNADDDDREQWPMGYYRPMNQEVGLLVDVGEPVTDGETHGESGEPE